MAVSKKEFNKWIEEGKKMGATHLISVCDTFDYDDYPVYVMPGENCTKKEAEYNSKDMQRVNEVIKL